MVGGTFHVLSSPTGSTSAKPTPSGRCWAMPTCRSSWGIWRRRCIGLSRRWGSAATSRFAFTRRSGRSEIRRPGQGVPANPRAGWPRSRPCFPRGPGRGCPRRGRVTHACRSQRPRPPAHRPGHTDRAHTRCSSIPRRCPTYPWRPPTTRRLAGCPHRRRGMRPKRDSRSRNDLTRGITVRPGRVRCIPIRLRWAAAAHTVHRTWPRHTSSYPGRVAGRPPDHSHTRPIRQRPGTGPR